MNLLGQPTLSDHLTITLRPLDILATEHMQRRRCPHLTALVPKCQLEHIIIPLVLCIPRSLHRFLPSFLSLGHESEEKARTPSPNQRRSTPHLNPRIPIFQSSSFSPCAVGALSPRLPFISLHKMQ